MYTDPIADYLTRIRNTNNARYRIVEVPASKLEREITKTLSDQGSILNYKSEEGIVQGTIKIVLKYDKVTEEPIIRHIERASRLGLRKYAGVDNLSRVLNGLGTAIISTSQGVMTGKKARELNIGGEVTCYVY